VHGKWGRPRADSPRSHYAIVVMPDFVTVRDDATGTLEHIQVVQILAEPQFPDAQRTANHSLEELLRALVRLNTPLASSHNDDTL
jgi:hypothetical protein